MADENKPTFEQKTEMEYARGREKAAENAARMEKAAASRQAEADAAEADKNAADEAAAAAKPLAYPVAGTETQEEQNTAVPAGAPGEPLETAPGVYVPPTPPPVEPAPEPKPDENK